MHHLILRQQLSSQAAPIVTALGAGRMEAAPARPVQDRLGRREDVHHETIDQSTHLGNSERDQFAELNPELSHGGPPLGAAATAPAAPAVPAPRNRDRTTAREARHSRAPQLRRDHPPASRTSALFTPTSPPAPLPLPPVP